MDDLEWTFVLKRTAAALRNGATRRKLEEALEHDLCDHAAAIAEPALESGGWPEDEEVSIANVRIEGGQLSADVTVYFSEVIPTACKDIAMREHRDICVELSMMRGQEFGVVEIPEPGDLIDRNSAADGT